MDKNILQKGMLALTWEKTYRKHIAEFQASSRPFVALQQQLDSDFAQFLDTHPPMPGNTVLDIGTGTGEQAIFMARRGLAVTATDLSASVLQHAREQAIRHGVTVDFREDNILATTLTGAYDIVIDRGCYTLIPAAFITDYITTVKALMRPGGILLLKTNRLSDTGPLEADTELQIVSSVESEYSFIYKKTYPARFLVIKKQAGPTWHYRNSRVSE